VILVNGLTSCFEEEFVKWGDREIDRLPRGRRGIPASSESARVEFGMADAIKFSSTSREISWVATWSLARGIGLGGEVVEGRRVATEQFSPPNKGLCSLRTAVFLAEEVGEELGVGKILLGQVSPG